MSAFLRRVRSVLTTPCALRQGHSAHGSPTTVPGRMWSTRITSGIWARLAASRTALKPTGAAGWRPGGWDGHAPSPRESRSSPACPLPPPCLPRPLVKGPAFVSRDFPRVPPRRMGAPATRLLWVLMAHLGLLLDRPAGTQGQSSGFEDTLMNPFPAPSPGPSSSLSRSSASADVVATLHAGGHLSLNGLSAVSAAMRSCDVEGPAPVVTDGNWHMRKLGRNPGFWPRQSLRRDVLTLVKVSEENDHILPFHFHNLWPLLSPVARKLLRARDPAALPIPLPPRRRSHSVGRRESA